MGFVKTFCKFAILLNDSSVYWSTIFYYDEKGALLLQKLSLFTTCTTVDVVELIVLIKFQVFGRSIET